MIIWGEVVRFVIVLCFLLSYSVSLFAADIGSDTAVNRFDVQQSLANGDRVAGFAALAAGFSMVGNVTATFDSFFPVSGTIELNFSTLVLNQDLITHDETEIKVLGSINGNGHIFEIAPDADCWGTFFNGEVCTITFTFAEEKGSIVNSVHFSFDSQFIVEGLVDGTLDVNEVINENFLENKATLAFGKQIFDVEWHPSKDFIALGATSGGGDEIATYTFDRVGDTITLIDSIDLGGGGTAANEVAWHPDGDHLAVASDLNSGEIRVYVINDDGTFGAVTTVNIAPDAISVAWNEDGTFLAVGTDARGGFDELRIYSFVKSPLGLTLDASANTGANVNSVSWNRGAGANGELVIGLQTVSDSFLMYRHDGAGTLTPIVTGVTVDVICNAVDWHLNGECVVAGFDANAGTEVRSYFFENDTLTEITGDEIGDNMLTVSWSPSGALLVTGDDGVGGGNPQVRLYETTQFGGGNGVTFDSLNLVFGGNVTLNRPALQFTGENSINGLTHMLSFAPTFSIEIQSNSSLLIKDAILKGINTGKLTLVDNTSTVSFQNVTILLDDDYVFDTGHFEILKDVTISGDGHSFIYQSTEPSMIRGRAPQLIAGGLCQPGFCGSLILDKGVTFSYDSTISSTLLVLENASSKIVMNSAILAETAGLQLTKGKLLVDGKSSFVPTQGITLGDGIAANNACLEMWPAGNLELFGTLIKQNIDA